MANSWDDATAPADSAVANTLGSIVRTLKTDLPTSKALQGFIGIAPHEFGGLAANVASPTSSYLSGATFDKLAPNTDIIDFDSANLPAGTYVLEACLVVSGGATVTLGIFNLTDGAPDTALVEITSTSATGQQVRSSAITFAASGASKKYGVKLKVSDTAQTYSAWGIRLKRTA